MFPLPRGASTELATKIDLEHSVVWNVVEGRREPRVTTAAKIAKGLGISLDKFYVEWSKVRQPKHTRRRISAK